MFHRSTTSSILERLRITRKLSECAARQRRSSLAGAHPERRAQLNAEVMRG